MRKFKHCEMYVYEAGDEFDEKTYEVWCDDGYMFDDGCACGYFETYQDALRAIKQEIVPDTRPE